MRDEPGLILVIHNPETDAWAAHKLTDDAGKKIIQRLADNCGDDKTWWIEPDATLRGIKRLAK